MTKIRCHWDADGLISGYLTSFGVENPEIQVGEYSKGFGATYDLGSDDYMVDMKPQDSDWDGDCIDHHPFHPPLTERKYSLIWKKKPASILCWKKFKEDIPKDEWWKVAIGAVGDGQPEKIPFEVWDSEPELYLDHNTYISKKYGQWKTYSQPAYRLLSSAINAFARYGEFEIALDLIKDAREPTNIIESPLVKKQKNKLSNSRTGDFSKAIKNCTIHSIGPMTLVVYDSKDARLSGYMASALEGSLDTGVVLAVNKSTGSLSLRGDMANYIQGKTKHLDYLTIAGHDGFCFDKETRVLTEDGWKYFEDVTKEDKFFSRNPETNEIELVKPIKLVKYKHNDKMIHFKGERTINLKVTPDHDIPYISDWNYRRNGIRKLSWKKARELKKYERLPTGGGDWEGNDSDTLKIGNEIYDTDTIAKFIGWYIAEGWTSKAGNFYNINICQSRLQNPGYCKEIENILNKLEMDWSYREPKSTYTFTDSNLGRFLYKNTGHKAIEKRIPEIFKKLSPKYLNKILDAFRKGDGHKRKRSYEIVYYTSSKNLVSDLSELILKCNRRPSIKRRNDKGRKFTIRNKEYETKHNGYIIRDCKRIYSVMKGKSKEIVDYDDFVYDVTLPKYHTLFVERNGKTIWSGNCGGEITKSTRRLRKDLMSIL